MVTKLLVKNAWPDLNGDRFGFFEGNIPREEDREGINKWNEWNRWNVEETCRTTRNLLLPEPAAMIH